MATAAFSAHGYTLYPSPRNQQRELFAYHVFVPYPYALIDLSGFALRGGATLFAAHRIADDKMGQLVSFELQADLAHFQERFTPD